MSHMHVWRLTASLFGRVAALMFNSSLTQCGFVPMFLPIAVFEVELLLLLLGAILADVQSGTVGDESFSIVKRLWAHSGNHESCALNHLNDTGLALRRNTCDDDIWSNVERLVLRSMTKEMPESMSASGKRSHRANRSSNVARFIFVFLVFGTTTRLDTYRVTGISSHPS